MKLSDDGSRYAAASAEDGRSSQARGRTEKSGGADADRFVGGWWDIKYTVKVDKATKMIEEIEMDFTVPIRKGASLFLNLAPAKDREEINDFIQKSTLNLQVTYSKFNQTGPVDVPQEAKDTAGK